MARASLYSGTTGFKKKTEVEEDIDITPMIDCVFLLLIFFMVTSTMQGAKALTLPSAKHGLGVNSKEAATVTVFADEGGPAVYLSDGDRKNGPVEMDEVAAYVKDSGKKVMIIKADQGVPSGYIEEVARAAADVVEDLEFFVGITDKHRR
ncbi:MAG: biopolymer transporter ExbD [Planctomycetota bacterium]|nr:MAG: biopolymer transporter ExbD [Planctomycetota bacterium]REJ93422.1 MAG: biopolymer transporter ExbD [Planctomycetota bacterium]REK25413.1 MAG: biopolymer transporter ExbD [Planctomycetota bacterium]REK38019.1 MAG: biopolymer transporter ExbD [Planctomycetota bacterium]